VQAGFGGRVDAKPKNLPSWVSGTPAGFLAGASIIPAKPEQLWQTGVFARNPVDTTRLVCILKLALFAAKQRKAVMREIGDDDVRPAVIIVLAKIDAPAGKSSSVVVIGISFHRDQTRRAKIQKSLSRGSSLGLGCSRFNAASCRRSARFSSTGRDGYERSEGWLPTISAPLWMPINDHCLDTENCSRWQCKCSLSASHYRRGVSKPAHPVISR